MEMDVQTRRHEADVSFRATIASDWKPTRAFGSLDEAREFFRRGDCGFSCALRADRLEGIQLRTMTWEMTPLAVDHVESAFYGNRERFPAGSVELDSALLMRGVKHEWHELQELPELAGHG